MSTFDTISQFARMLENTDRWLQAGTDYAQKKSFDPDVLAHARLAPDQYALVQQVQAACDAAKYAAAYLSGTEVRFNRRGRAVVRRASGILFVTGSNVEVVVLGGGLTFAAAGYGRARFRGSGTYRLNSDAERAWASKWIRIAPTQTSRRGRR